MSDKHGIPRDGRSAEFYLEQCPHPPSSTVSAAGSPTQPLPVQLRNNGHCRWLIWSELSSGCRASAPINRPPLTSSDDKRLTTLRRREQNHNNANETCAEEKLSYHKQSYFHHPSDLTKIWSIDVVSVQVTHVVGWAKIIGTPETNQ